MIIDVDQKTLPKMFKENNYSTAIIGKWHLGLGDGQINYNSKISPGPNEVSDLTTLILCQILKTEFQQYILRMDM